MRVEQNKKNYGHDEYEYDSDRGGRFGNKRVMAILLASIILSAVVIAVLASMLIRRDGGTSSSFSPKIDGLMTADDHWELATNVHAYYLTTDGVQQKHDYNFVYSRIEGNGLFLCFDFCSDTTDSKAEGEYIIVFVDSDGSFDLFNYTTLFTHGGSGEHFLEEEFAANLNASIEHFFGKLGSSIEVVAWNVTSGKKLVTFGDLNRPGTNGTLPPVTINSTADFTVATGFAESKNRETKHRIFEFNVTLASLSGLSGDADSYGILIEGYGTAMTPISREYDEVGFYCLPGGGLARLGWELDGYVMFTVDGGYYPAVDDPFPNTYTRFVAMMLIASNEYYYFRCGTSANDLN